MQHDMDMQDHVHDLRRQTDEQSHGSRLDFLQQSAEIDKDIRTHASERTIKEIQERARQSLPGTGGEQQQRGSIPPQAADSLATRYNITIQEARELLQFATPEEIDQLLQWQQEKSRMILYDPRNHQPVAGLSDKDHGNALRVLKSTIRGLDKGTAEFQQLSQDAVVQKVIEGRTLNSNEQDALIDRYWHVFPEIRRMFDPQTQQRHQRGRDMNQQIFQATTIPFAQPQQPQQ